MRSKWRALHCGKLQLAQGVVGGNLEDHILVYTGGSVRKRQVSAMLAAVLGEATRQAGLHNAQGVSHPQLLRHAG